MADDVTVRRVAEHAQERGGEELATATAAVEIDVKQIVGVELHFQPGSAVWNDTEGMKKFAVKVWRGFEANTWRAVELTDNDALSPVDDKLTTAEHNRNVA